jgi:hypothetical protein
VETRPETGARVKKEGRLFPQLRTYSTSPIAVDKEIDQEIKKKSKDKRNLSISVHLQMAG